MKKTRFTLATALVLSCTTALAEDTQFFIDATKVTLTQKFNNPVFYTQAQLEQRIDSCVKDKLTAKKLLAAQPTPETVHVNIDINYQRVYNGEAFGSSSSVGSPVMGYKITGIQNGQNKFTYADANLRMSYGLFGNIMKSVTMGLEQTKAEDENQYVEALCKEAFEKITD